MGKKVKGRKRHITTDNLGLVYYHAKYMVQTFRIVMEQKMYLQKPRQSIPTIVKFFADGSYAGALHIWCFLTLGTLLAIARKIVDQVGFKVVP